MIKLYLVEIKNKYIQLINHQISRDEAGRWANSMIQKHERRELIYFPVEDESKIRRGLGFLNGIDIQEPPGEYLNSDDDIKEILEKELN